MELEEFKKAAQKTVGTKQTLRAVKEDRALKVFIARDAQAHVYEPLLKMCAEKKVPVVWVESMMELGRACEIEVGCASAAILK